MRKQIRDGKGSIIGEKRYLDFEFNEIDSGFLDMIGVKSDFSKCRSIL